MSILALGVSHHTADLSLLERLAVPADDVPKALRSIVSLEHVVEAAVLSTCNRVEIYAHVTMFHPAVEELRDWLAGRGQLPPEELDEVAYWRYDDQAAAHLFGVAGGLDSMIVGERQIALQVRDAMKNADAEGTARRVLDKLFRQAVKTGRRVRNETEIDSGASSIVDVGIDLAAEEVGGLDDLDVLLVGAGKLGALTAERLAEEAPSTVRMWNRSRDKAERLADRVDGHVVEPGSLASAIETAELVVCTTGSPIPLIDRGMLGDRSTRPLMLLDLAVPRNVAAGCADIPGVRLLDLGDVRDVADRTVTGTVLREAQKVVDEEARAFLAWQRAWEVEPTIKALRTRAEDVRTAELDRLSGKLKDLDDEQRETVEMLTKGILNTLLHEPTVRLKDLADAGGAEHYVNALRELFDLDESAGDVDDQPPSTPGG